MGVRSMNACLKPGDQRRIIAAAKLLLSDKPGEVVAAVGAIGRMLPSGETLSSVIERGVTFQPEPRPAPVTAGYVYRGDWRQRAGMARSSPHINDYERGFLKDIMDRRNLSVRQESLLKAILRKSNGGAS